MIDLTAHEYVSTSENSKFTYKVNYSLSINPRYILAIANQKKLDDSGNWINYFKVIMEGGYTFLLDSDQKDILDSNL